jgi:hypothetical protein
MADDDVPSSAPAGRGGGGKDIRFDYLRSRVCTALKVREEAFDRLLTGETRWAAGPSGAGGGWARCRWGI